LGFTPNEDYFVRNTPSYEIKDLRAAISAAWRSRHSRCRKKQTIPFQVRVTTKRVLSMDPDPSDVRR